MWEEERANSLAVSTERADAVVPSSVFSSKALAGADKIQGVSCVCKQRGQLSIVMRAEEELWLGPAALDKDIAGEGGSLGVPGRRGSSWLMERNLKANV